MVFFFLFVFLCLWMPFQGCNAFSAEIAAPKTRSPEKSSGPASNTPIKGSKAKAAFDIFFILDQSGSMKKTDPQDFRKAAAELLVTLLGPEDRLGLISFGDSAQTLIPLTQNFPENQKGFSRAVQKITSRDLNTDLYAAIKKGYEEIKPSQNSNKILILFSDGQMDLGDKEKDASALKALGKLLPELVKDHIKLYTVAFSDFSDRKLLNDLAQETKGLFNLAQADKDIHVIFASIFEQVKMPDTVPLEGDSFFIDKEIQEATLLITKQIGTLTKLIDPNRKELVYDKLPEGIAWYQTKAFDLITIKKPIPGRWKVQLSTKEGNKIFVVTDLALKSSLKQNHVFQGEKVNIDAWLEREDQTVTEKRFLESIFFMTDIKGPDGNHVKLSLFPLETGDSRDKEGKYSNAFTFKQTGDYTIQILADGKTFKREQVRQVKVLNRPTLQSPPAPTSRAVKTTVPTKADEIWKKAFIKLGLIHLGFLVIVLIFFGALKWNRKKAGPKKKEGSLNTNDPS